MAGLSGGYWEYYDARHAKGQWDKNSY